MSCWDLHPQSTRAALFTALPQDVTNHPCVCGKAPHRSTNTHMLSNIIS